MTDNCVGGVYRFQYPCLYIILYTNSNNNNNTFNLNYILHPMEDFSIHDFIWACPVSWAKCHPTFPCCSCRSLFSHQKQAFFCSFCLSLLLLLFTSRSFSDICQTHNSQTSFPTTERVLRFSTRVEAHTAVQCPDPTSPSAFFSSTFFSSTH